MIQLSETDRTFFDTEGYLKLEGVLQGERLAQVQAEFTRVEEGTREQWLQSVQEGVDFRPYKLGETAHVVFPVAPHGDIFVDLMELPETIGIAERFIGPDIQMIDNALHVKPAGTKAHTGWHIDNTTWRYDDAKAWSAADEAWWDRNGAAEEPFAKIKIFYFIEDVDEDTAPFSVVPRTHKVDVSGSGVPRHENLEDMPHHLKLVGRAGDAILWNGAIWHTAMNNTGDKARRMLLYNYTHFGMPQHEPCVPKGEFADSLKQRSSLCRQLFGLERMARA